MINLKVFVYSISEIEKFIQKPTIVIQFNHHFNLKNYISYKKLKIIYYLDHLNLLLRLPMKNIRLLKKEGELMNVLLSIKPKYVEEIKKGNKKYEFRKSLCSKEKREKI